MANSIDDRVVLGNVSHVMHAVFDKTRVAEAVISKVNTPYDIWNNPDLRGRSSKDPAYVLTSPAEERKVASYFKKLEELRQNPNIEVKIVRQDC